MGEVVIPAVMGALRLLGRLFNPDGVRLGWEFRERRQFLIPFPEPRPYPREVPWHLRAAVDRARLAALNGREDVRRWGGGLTGGLLALTVLIALCGAGVGTVAALGVLTTAAGVGSGLLLWQRTRSAGEAEAQLVAAELQIRQEDTWLLHQWDQRRIAYDAAEWQRVNEIDEFGAVLLPTDSHRLDIFGSNPHSIEAFLTVFGTSMLARRPLTVIDLSYARVSRELVGLASAAGVPVDAQVLPGELAGSDALVGVTPAELVNLLVEAVHGKDAGEARRERAADHRVLTGLVAGLGENLSMERIIGGLRALEGEPVSTDVLAREEYLRIADELMSDETRKRSADSIGRLADCLLPLRALRVTAPERTAYFNCLSLDEGLQTITCELLIDLLVLSATRKVAAEPHETPALIIAGADKIGLRNLEHLAKVCHRNQVHLTLQFDHLRDSALDMIGGGHVGFMKLGNHREAEQAAEYLGKGHTFVVTQLTHTLGANETRSTADMIGGSVADTISVTETVNWSTSTSTGTSHSRVDGSLFGNSTDTESTTKTDGGSVAKGTSRTKSRNWSKTETYAAGSNWSDAEARSRVHEHHVDAEAFRHIRDYTLLLADTTGATPGVRAIEINPDFITLPRVTTGPLTRPVLRAHNTTVH